MLEMKQIPRIAALDLLRGYFLISIVLNHLYLYPNGLGFLTAQGQLFVSSAEGFFLISGIVLGIVRGRKLLDKPLEVGAKLLLKRAAQLYVTYAILVIAFTFIGWQFLGNPGLKPGIAAPDTSIAAVIWETLTFQYMYGWADYLRLYAIFIFLSPLALWLLRQGKWWIVLAISFGVWLFTPETGWPENQFTQQYHWQVIFFSGLVLGFHWPEITEFWRARSQRMRRVVTASFVTISLVTLAANLYLSFGGVVFSASQEMLAQTRDTWYYEYFNKENLQPLRLLMFAIWFSAAFWLFNRFQHTIQRFFGWILLPFGTNSLYVYTVHAFIIFFVHLIVPAGSTNFFVNFPVVFGVLALIWVLVHYQILFKIIPR